MNVILLTVDCLRADHISILGYPKKTSPNLDSLSGTGVLFSQAISVGCWTLSSFKSIFTSTYPLMHGGQLYITKSTITVAQVLQEHGYHTGAFHSNPWLLSRYGYHNGFDSFDEGLQDSSVEGSLYKAKTLVKRIIGTGNGLHKFLDKAYLAIMGSRARSDAAVINKKGLSWLHDNRDNFFLWLHYMDLHEPCGISSRFMSPLRRVRALPLQQRASNSPIGLTPKDVNELIDLYDREIHYVDKALASLMRSLKRDGFLDDTFVIVTADHGQQFMEHGLVFHDVHLYDELVHVPLVIIGPGLASGTISQQVSLLDLAPTILDIIGIEKPKTFLGKSLLPLMMKKTTVCSWPAISEEGRNRRGDCDIRRPKLYPSQRKISLRTGKWKYIYTEGVKDEMYHLENDPGETQNIIDIEPEVARGMRNMIMDHIEFEDKSTPDEKDLIKAKIGKLKRSGKL